MKSVTAAIEFGTSKVMCVVGREKSVGRFEVLGAGEAKYEGIKNGRWLKPSNVEEAVAKALSIAERKAKKRVREVFVGVPGGFSKVICCEGYTEVAGSRITEKDIENMIEDAEHSMDDIRYTIVSSTPVYFVLEDGHHYIDVVGSSAHELKGLISFVFAANEFIQQVTGAMNSIGVKIRSFIPEVLAESLFLVPTEERDCSAVLLNIGYFDTNVTVVYGDAIVYNKTVHAGGMHIANDLSIVMNMEVDAAEQIKKRFSFGLENNGTKLYDYAKLKNGRLEKYNHTMVAEVIDARIEQICMMIYEALLNSPLAVARRTRVYLSGGGVAMMKGSRDTLQKYLKRQVRISTIEAPQLATPNYYVALALLDYVFESDFLSEGRSRKSILGRLSEKMFD
jgi:cell division protein FtsA